MASIPLEIQRELCPTGRMRVGINLGNTVLAQTNSFSGALTGVTVELARKLGEHLEAEVDFVKFTTAGKVFDALKRGQLDIVFLAIDPLRGEEISFSPPYVLIEGNFVVQAESNLASRSDIDRLGIHIAVARSSAYDLFLSRTLAEAMLIRTATGVEALEMLIADKVQIAAGVKQLIVKFMSEHSGLRLIDPPFMEIRQAIGTPRGRSAGAAFLRAFIEEMKASGFIADALRRSGQYDVTVAPLTCS